MIVVKSLLFWVFFWMSVADLQTQRTRKSSSWHEINSFYRRGVNLLWIKRKFSCCSWLIFINIFQFCLHIFIVFFVMSLKRIFTLSHQHLRSEIEDGKTNTSLKAQTLDFQLIVSLLMREVLNIKNLLI